MRTITAFGYQDRESPRHWTVCETLRKEGWMIADCHTARKGFMGKCSDLAAQYKRIRNDVEAVLVPFPGHFLMPIAWMLTRRPRKQLIFDAFISLYDTDVTDRQRYSKFHPWAWVLWMIDWLSMHLADDVLIDTPEHAAFLCSEFHLDPSHVRVIPLEAKPDLFFPAHQPKPQDERLRLLFYGTDIPLQGIGTILAAMKILEEQKAPVELLLIGPRKLIESVQSLRLSNVSTHAFMTLPEIADAIRASDLCLGIFGTSGKAQRVVPHKVIDAVACHVPVLTGDTPAIRTRFGGNPLVQTCAVGNPEELARAIIVFASKP